MTRFVPADIVVAPLPGAGVPVVALVGLPGLTEEVWIYRSEAGWRTLWPTRGIPARLLERADSQGVPALRDIVAAAFPELVEA